MRLIVFLVLVFLATVIGGLYGVLHDQVSYSISPEFFYKLRFPNHPSMSATVHPRLKAAYAGWSNTWPIGLALGGILSLVGLMHHNIRRMFTVTFISFFITLGTAFLFGLIGLYVGSTSAGNDDIYLSLPKDLHDPYHFMMVQNMQNFSYVGALAGLLISFFYHLYIRNKNIKHEHIVEE